MGRMTFVLIATALLPSAALASETITYTYDANGRVIQITRTGTVNNNVQIAYQHDDADNRTRATTTGSPNPPQ